MNPQVSPSSGVIAVSTPVTPDMIRDIKGPVSVEASLFFWSMVAAILLLVLAAWILYRHKKPSASVPAPQEPLKPAGESALELMEKAWGDYLKSADLRRFYLELSSAFRQYLGSHFIMDALEKTSSEIFSEMRQMEVERKICLKVREILSSHDLVKFAKFSPSAKQVEADYFQAREFVQEMEKQGNMEKRPAGEKEGVPAS